MRENECVGLVNKVLYDLGSEHVEGVNAISGERCNRRIPTSTPTACCARATRRTSTSCTATWATARATTARSRSASASPALVDAYKRCRYYPRRGDRDDPARRHHRRGVSRVAEGAGVRLPRRGGRVRAPVRPRRRAVDLGEADLQPAGLARPSRGDRGGHGVRARDLLARHRRLVGGADRGAAGGHRRRLRGHHALPGRGPDDRRQATTTRSADRCRSSARSPPSATRCSTTTRSRRRRRTAVRPATWAQGFRCTRAPATASPP